MSVYRNDVIGLFQNAVRSILEQEAEGIDARIYLGIDGDIPSEIEEYVNQEPSRFYKIVRNKQNQGLAAILNKLIDSLEDEEFVFRMDADDSSRQGRIKKQVEFLRNNPEIGLVGSAILEVNTDGSVKGTRNYPISDTEIRKYMWIGSPYAHPSVAFRRSLFNGDVRYPTNYLYNEDVALWFKLAKANIKGANLAEPLYSLTITDSFYKRRQFLKAKNEFRAYMGGLWDLNGISWRYIFPVLRFLSRLMPEKAVKKLYTSNLRFKLMN